MQINAKSTTSKVVAAGVLIAGTWGVTTYTASAQGGDRAAAPAPLASSSSATSTALAKKGTPVWAYRSITYTSPAGQVTSGEAPCPDKRYKVTGGGVRTTSDDQFVNETAPFDNSDKGKAPDDGWTVYVGNEDTSDHDFTVWAICKR